MENQIKLDRITIEPEIMGGQPCIRGLRIPVSIMVKLVARGKTSKEILADKCYWYKAYTQTSGKTQIQDDFLFKRGSVWRLYGRNV